MDVTNEQREIAEAAPDARMLVVAGAGTGKTRVLAARLAALTETHGLAAGADVLVLSFSRAAVGEVTRRLASAGSYTAYASASTFDAFATGLLSIVDPNGTWMGCGYDDRIRAAAEAIERGGAAAEEVARRRHVLVDEVQDLVGIRARLVLAILRHCGGFTLFGDPAQSIYDYQIRADDRRDDHRSLFRAVRREYGGRLVECQLRDNFRAKTPVARAAADFGPRLSAADIDVKAVRDDIDLFVLELPPIGALGAFAPMLNASSATTAILCRTNAQALLVSRRLHELGVGHRLQREAQDRFAPAWVAAALEGLPPGRLGRTRFLPRLQALQDQYNMRAEAMWSMLKLLDPGRRDELDTRRVAERIRSRDIPEDLNYVPEATTVVSTVHRAKGLEFDRVVLVEPQLPDEESDLAEETRLLYVALTRASREIFVLEPPDTAGMRRERPAGDRWVRRGFGTNRWRVFAIEVRGDDTDAADPADFAGAGGANAGETQNELREHVRTGQRAELVFERATTDGSAGAVYAVVVAGRKVGKTSEPFVSELGAVIGIRRDRTWPKRIANLFVEGVDSVAGADRVGDSAGLGPSGIWNRVRVSGLGELEWEPASL